MHNGQTNTGSRGLKVVSPKAGSAREIAVRRVGAIRVERHRLGLRVPHVKLSLGSFSVPLDKRDMGELISALQATADEVFS